MANTKRALLTSALAIVACVAMLIGSTFAWFTDTAGTGVNKIQAGNLKIELQMKDNRGNWVNAEDETLDFVKAEGHGNEEVLWEPGVRYALPELRIVNKGDLALKYRVVIAGAKDATPDNGIDDLKLLDVIDWTYSVSGKGGEDVSSLDTERHLAAKTGAEDVYDTLKIMGTMQTTAGNDYQGMAVEGIAIKVYATQDTVESDSFDNQYDKDATYYPVLDQAGLKDALAAGGNVKVDGDFTTDASKTAAADRTVIAKPTTIDFGGMITVPGELEASSNWAALYINADTTINGTETTGITCVDKTDPNAGYNGGPYVAHIAAPGKTVTVNGGYYYGGGTTFNVEHGTLIVNGGFFPVTPDIGTHDYRYVLNCIDANYKNGSANIIVRGGTFVNFDPSNNAAEGAGTNFVEDGYVVVAEEQANGDTWYTVVKKVTYTTIAEAFPDADFGYGSTATEPVVLDGKGAVTVSGWTDAWVNADTTVKGVTFKNGAVFSTKADNVTVTLEDCTFYACDQSKLTYTGHNSLTNSGAGMCLNLEKSANTGVKFIVKNCTFIGENDATLPVYGNKYNGDGSVADAYKKRGHAIAIDAICGGGTGTLDSVLIEGCTIDGVRGNAIQLYGKTGAITIKDTKINSWGINNGAYIDASGTKKDANSAAIRGDLVVDGSRTLTIKNVYFGLAEDLSDNMHQIRHVHVGDYTGNTDGTEGAGTYSK